MTPQWSRKGEDLVEAVRGERGMQICWDAGSADGRQINREPLVSVWIAGCGRFEDTSRRVCVIQFCNLCRVGSQMVEQAADGIEGSGSSWLQKHNCRAQQRRCLRSVGGCRIDDRLGDIDLSHHYAAESPCCTRVSLSCSCNLQKCGRGSSRLGAYHMSLR